MDLLMLWRPFYVSFLSFDWTFPLRQIDFEPVTVPIIQLNGVNPHGLNYLGWYTHFLSCLILAENMDVILRQNLCQVQL